MGSSREGNHQCGHIWRRPKKRELDVHDNPKQYVICNLCGTMIQVPFDLALYYDIYFPSFPDDNKD